MQMATLWRNIIGSWGMLVAYEGIVRATGLELRALLYGALVVMAIGLYGGCQENKETAKGEA